MLLITCPYCGARPELEFTHAGQAHITRPGKPEETQLADWTRFLYLRDNTRGPYRERWRHVHGCGRFFNAIRDTTTDQFVRTYPIGEPP